MKVDKTKTIKKKKKKLLAFETQEGRTHCYISIVPTVIGCKWNKEQSSKTSKLINHRSKKEVKMYKDIITKFIQKL